MIFLLVFFSTDNLQLALYLDLKKVFFLSFIFLGPHLRHMEVPRLGVESELQLLAYTKAHGNAGSLTC